MRMFTAVAGVNDTGALGRLFSAWDAGDIYLQLSVFGLCVFVVLCFLICLAWLRYGAVISTVFDAKSKETNTV